MPDVDDPKEFPHLPDRIAGLGELAFNLWWSWHPEARILFKRLNRELWKDSFYNPVKLLTILPPEVLAKAAGDGIVGAGFKPAPTLPGCQIYAF